MSKLLENFSLYTSIIYRAYYLDFSIGRRDSVHNRSKNLVDEELFANFLARSLVRSASYSESLNRYRHTYMHSRGTHLMIAYGIFQFVLHGENFFLQTLRYFHVFTMQSSVFPPCSKIRLILAREEEDGKPLLPLTLTLPPN